MRQKRRGQAAYNKTQRQKNLALGYRKVTVLIPSKDRDRLLKVAEYLRNEASNEG